MRGAQAEFLSLGPMVRAWIEDHCVVPDGPRMGERFVLTDEMALFVDDFYTLDVPKQQWVFPRGGQLIRPQKWGKGPFSAALICAEAAGPVLPVWENGQLVGGRPWDTPWIQVTAVSEDQTANVFRALLPMIQLSPSLDMEIADTGLTRVNLPGGGFIEPVTASARSRLGQRITFVVQDETHSWVQTNGGVQLADNQRRNLAGMGGRFLETTNAFDPAENSVAQKTFEAKSSATLIDDAEPPAGSVRNYEKRRRVLRAVYGDSLKEKGGWVDLDRIDLEIEALLEHDPAQAERFFLNRKMASEGAAFDFEQWKSLVRAKYTPPGDAVITIGIDGARHDDALAIVACEVKTGFVWPLDIIERPEDADEDYVHDTERARQVVRDAFQRWPAVWRVYADPQHIADLLVGWANEFGDQRVVKWETYRPRPIAWAVRNFETAISRGELSHPADEVLDRHIGNARRRKLTVLDDKERQMHTLSKDGVKSPRKIDGAMAAVLAWEARADCIKAGGVSFAEPLPERELPREESWVPGRAPGLGGLVGGGVVSGPLGSLS